MTSPIRARKESAKVARVLEDDLLTIMEAAAQLKLSRSAVYDEVRDGHLPCVRVRGGRIRIKASDLAQYITRRTESRPWRIEARRRRTSSAGGTSGTPGTTTSTGSGSGSPPGAPASGPQPKSLLTVKDWRARLGLKK